MGQERLDRCRDDDRGMVCRCRGGSWGQNLVERSKYMLFSYDLCTVTGCNGTVVLLKVHTGIVTNEIHTNVQIVIHA